jgi:hypothetical protein
MIYKPVHPREECLMRCTVGLKRKWQVGVVFLSGEAIEKACERVFALASAKRVIYRSPDVRRQTYLVLRDGKLLAVGCEGQNSRARSHVALQGLRRAGAILRPNINTRDLDPWTDQG